MKYALSVIVCSYNRYPLLQQTLEKFERAQTDNTGIELIVVENTPIALRSKISLPKNIRGRVVTCERTGLSAARNAGVTEAAGQHVVFLDDDALICKDWANKFLDAFERSRSRVVGGKVVPKYPLTEMPQWYYEELSGYLSCIDWGPKAKKLQKGQWIVGANMGFHRSVFEEHGLFDLSLGRKGEGSLLSNEEIELFEKIGIENILYDPHCYVEHIIPSDRISIKWFRRRVFWQAVSDALAGIQYGSYDDLRREYGMIAGRLPPQFRNINMLSFEPETSDQMRSQLRALYILTTISHLGHM